MASLQHLFCNPYVPTPASVSLIVKAEGFARLPRRRDEERPDTTRPTVAEVADVRELARTIHEPTAADADPPISAALR